MSDQASQLAGLGNIGKIPELKNRILFTLGMLIVYRIGAHIPVPGIDAQVLAQFFSQAKGSLLGLFDMFSGGALSRLTIFALGIMPYISAAIILQLMTIVSPQLEQLKKEGEAGRRKITQYTRYGTVALALVQAVGMSIGLETFSVNGHAVVIDPGWAFRAVTAITLVSGTIFLMWVGEQITERGIGNGISMIIFAGIVAGLPRAIGGTLELARTGEFSPFTVIGLFIMVVAVTAFVVFVERAQRRIPIQYAKRQVGNRMYGGKASFLPLKVNTAGVIPPIFASSLILLPATFAQFTKGVHGFSWLSDLSAVLSPGHWLYLVLFTVCIVLLYGHRVQPEGHGRQPEEARRLYPGHPSGAEDLRVRRFRADPHHRGRRSLRDAGLPAAAVSDQSTVRTLLLRRHQPADRGGGDHGHHVPGSGASAVAPV